MVNIILAIVFFIAIILSVVIFAGSKKSKGTVYMGWASFWASIWVLSMFLFRITDTEHFLTFPARTLYISGILIAQSFLLFSFIFLDHSANPIVRRRTRILLNILTFLLVGTTIFTTSIISGVATTNDGNVVFFGQLYPLYGIILVFYFIWAYHNFFRRYRIVDNDDERIQLKYIIVGTLISVATGLYFDILAPFLFRDFQDYWIGPAFIVFFVGITTFAISKYRLFSIRVIATQLFVFALWIFQFIRLFTSVDLQDKVINGVVLLATIVIGVLVIRSVIQEVATRERIQALAGELGKANDELGKANDELGKANERLKELDKQKSEFVSIASHQLRAPLTAMKGYSSMLLEGSFGALTDKAHEAIDRIFQSSQRLVIIIEDFLNISRIEQGRMQYEFSSVDLEGLVQGIIKELGVPIKNAGLTLEYKREEKGPFIITADSGKMHQVVGNLIDNAIKYTPTGGITITIHKDESTRKITLKIKDTGVGIAPEVMPRLFEKFSRADDTDKANIQGTGLGLFVAKEIMKAHHGRVWAESEGKGLGSTFFLEFMGE